MRFIMKYAMKYKLNIFFGLLIKIIGTVFDLVIPYILSYILDSVVPLGEYSRIIWFGLLMLGCAIGAMVFNVIANRKAAYIAYKTTYDIRKELFKKITELDQNKIDQLTIPSLVSRMTSDTYNINSVLGTIQRLGVRAPILLIGGITMTLFLDPILTLIMVALLPMVFLSIFLITKFGVPLFSKVQYSYDKIVSVVRENVTGAKVVKALDKSEYEINKFKNDNNDLSSNDIRANKRMASLNPFLNVLMNFGLVAVLYFGASRVYHGFTGSGKIIGFITYFTMILNAMLSISRVFISISKASASASRIKEVMDLESELTITKDNEQFDNFIEFNHVSFSYNKKNNNLSDISFSLKEGETLGIIGPTGSGKTTIINLLLRFYDANQGKIIIDHKNIKSISDNELHSLFGIVFQNDIIFKDSIYNNIDFKRNVSYDEVKEAIKISQADFALKNGLSYELTSKGTNLSGGQRQRILLSRAVANNPKILILDDSSSALDYKTDLLLRQALDKELPLTTKIIVASRISAVKDCTKILVIDNGKMIAIGSHDYLMENCELYQLIKTSQMGGDADEL